MAWTVFDERTRQRPQQRSTEVYWEVWSAYYTCKGIAEIGELCCDASSSVGAVREGDEVDAEPGAGVIGQRPRYDGGYGGRMGVQRAGIEGQH